MNVDEQLLAEANKLKLTLPFKYAAVTHAHWGHTVWFVENCSDPGCITYRFNNDMLCFDVTCSLQTISLSNINELHDIIIKIIK